MTGVLQKVRAAGLTLPSPSTIKGCKRFGCDEAGWTESLFNGLVEVMKDLKPISKYGIISFDEVKVKEGLVFDPHGGTLIGTNNYYLIHLLGIFVH